MYKIIYQTIYFMFRSFKVVVEQYVKSVMVSDSKSETLSQKFSDV